MRMLTSTTSQLMGAIILIGVSLPYFLIPVVVVGIVYYWIAMFYRPSARELKVFLHTSLVVQDITVSQRLDAILRSSLYSHFSESLSGLGTIRAYGEKDRFRKDNQKYIDIENRAHILTTINQRFLGVYFHG